MQVPLFGHSKHAAKHKDQIGLKSYSVYFFLAENEEAEKIDRAEEIVDCKNCTVYNTVLASRFFILRRTKSSFTFIFI